MPAKTIPATAPASAPRVRLDYLHGLRGLAALTVVLGHCAELAQPEGATPPLTLQVVRYAASLAVPLFIVLSGYCLALPVARTGCLEGGAWGFPLRRARRILPAYYGALALSLVVATLLVHSMTPAAALSPALLGPLLLLHDVYGSVSPFDVPLWSLAVEWHCYWGFPLLIWCVRRYGPAPTLGLWAGLAIAAWALAPALGLRASALHPQLYVLFALGAAVAWWQRRPALAGRPAAWRLGTGSLCGAGSALLLICGWASDVRWLWLHTLLWGAACAALLLALAARPGRTGALLGRRPLVALGEVSYSLYVLHWVPATVLATTLAGWSPAQGWGALPTSLALALAVVPLSLGLALVSYRLLERPVLRGRAAAPSGAGQSGAQDGAGVMARTAHAGQRA